jgi:hypothetical protein
MNPLKWFNKATFRTHSIAMAAIALALLFGRNVERVFYDEFQTGKATRTIEGDIEVSAPAYLHPGDSSIVTISSTATAKQQDILCALFASDVDIVLLEKATQEAHGMPNFRTGNICSWAIAPKSPGTKLIVYHFGSNTRFQTGYRTLTVKEFPFSIANMSAVAGALAAVAGFTAAIRGEKTHLPEIPDTQSHEDAVQNSSDESGR